MTTPIAFAAALTVILAGDGVIFLLDRALGSLSRAKDEYRNKSVLRAESPLGLWGSLVFVFILVGIVYSFTQIALPFLDIPLTPWNFLIIGGSSFILGAIFGVAREADIPPPLLSTIILFSLITTVYSIVRWLFSEVVTLPAGTSQAGIFLIGLLSAVITVSLIIDEATVSSLQGTGDKTKQETDNSEHLAHTDSGTERQGNSRVSSGGKSRTTSHSNQSDTGVDSGPRREQFTNSDYDWGYSLIRFDDIGGYYDVKQTLVEDIIEPLRAAERGDDRFDRFGIQPERGILLYGPPGTGKTLFARALAGELNIPFVELSPSDVTSKWINEGPDRIKQLFDEASRIGPSVIFIDEAEHLFGARATDSRNTHAEDRKVTTEFLVHLTRDDREAIVVAATNRPGDIDPAILRPGRLTAHYEIGLPDSEARHAILQSKLRGVPSEVSGDQLAELADHTRGFTGADLENLVDDAKRSAAKRDGDAVTIDDFPSFTELDRRVADIERAYESSALPDPDDPSEMTPPTDDTDTDDDSAVGYQ
ncbi:ATP-binding protein [Salinigranum salinum]|uniref:ATP-binding protein n=1 Tax=Salinigranum salinum TaxID=1364937 RepID=UPI001261354B|nr:ATP-binding protein [Salinigranum salinum]